MFKIPAIWTQNLKNKEDKKEFERVLLESSRVVNRLRDILERELELLEKDSLSKTKYHIPNWDKLQADIIGQKRATKKLLNFVTLERTDG